MNLHTLNKTGQAMQACFNAIAETDALILLEDGVYAMGEYIESALPESVKCYAIADDISSRAVRNASGSHVVSINWQDFVSLSAKYDKVISWG